MSAFRHAALFRHALLCGPRSWWCDGIDAALAGEVVVEIAYLERDGAVVTLRGLPPGALFDTGPIHVPASAMRALETSRRCAWPLLLRHVRGDWGAFGGWGTAGEGDMEPDGARAPPPDTARRNVQALQSNEGRVVSEFATAEGGPLWIITHLGEGGYTTFLVSD
jgi:hypothetical protein